MRPTSVLLRIGDFLLVLLAVAFLVFTMAIIIPGDVALQLTGVEGATEENLARVRAELGLDDPFFLRFGNWLLLAVQGDFGVSPLTGRPIRDDVLAAFPVSMELSLLSVLGAALIGIPVGIFAALKSQSRVGQSIRISLIVLLSIPSFVLGALFVFFASRYWPALYGSLYVRPSESLPEHIRVMILPVLALSLVLAGVFAQVTRNSLVQELQEPYIRTLRAYGLPSRRIVLTYALRGALAQILTVGALLFGAIIGGTVITERVFSLPGMGNTMITAIGQRDFGLAVFAILMITVVYLLLNLIVDLIATRLDPRRANI